MFPPLGDQEVPLQARRGSQRPHATGWQQFRAVLRKNLLLRLRGG